MFSATVLKYVSRQSQVKQLEAGDVSLPVTVYCVYYRVSYMCTTHALELQGPDDVCGELLGVCQGHTHHPVRLCPPAGPVLKKNNSQSSPCHGLTLVIGSLSLHVGRTF